MSQNTTVMSFRKRLTKRGYKDISIKVIKDVADTYKISAVEPLGGTLIQANYNIIAMYNSFRF
ncbi:hypothetical protein RBG61_01365 [Paludicola sp. MB14-C6]|uniref:hypothetical protein n=1 Tax=Paludihabitans sp. MB14-C6 TaxID=3070656 RepID=UPI0027DDDEEC|nr:hypothetical protein [Paludicola sp. MB14-C6]WMJ23338.1 hypothetical protein RBG61_01365 [Paludicola sp. MB14-C6]